MPVTPKAGNPLISEVTGGWKTDSAVTLLRGIYLELRVQNSLLAKALGAQSVLDGIRQDYSSVYPEFNEWSNL